MFLNKVLASRSSSLPAGVGLDELYESMNKTNDAHPRAIAADFEPP